MAEEIEITQEDVQNSITFLEEVVTDKFPDVDFSLGTANRDIAINSIAVTVAFIRNEVSNFRNRQSLLKLSELDADESVDDAVDEILSNWFITRKVGQTSRGVVTLSFSSRDIGNLYISVSDTISRDDSTFFKFSDGNIFLTGDDLTQNVTNDGVVYYTKSLSVECTETGLNDLDPGTFSSWTISSPYLFSIDNFSKFIGGEGIESTEDLITRSQTAITVRDLNTSRSIDTVLSDTFAQVEAVYPVGYGDPEMQRDLLDVNLGLSGTVSIHRGSMMDIWGKFPLEFNKSITVTPTTQVIEGTPITYFTYPSDPILRIVSLQDPTVTPAEDVPYTLQVNDFKLALSDRQDTYVVVDSSYANLDLTLTYDTVVGYSDVSQYVANDNDRVLVADPLVKALHPMYLKFTILYHPTQLELDVEAAKTFLINYIQTYSIRSTLSVSEVVSTLINQYSEYISSVEFPVVIVGTIYDSTGNSIVVNYTDQIEVPSKIATLTDSSIQGLFGNDEEPAGSTVINSTDIQLSQSTTRYIVPEEDLVISAIEA